MNRKELVNLQQKSNSKRIKIVISEQQLHRVVNSLILEKRGKTSNKISNLKITKNGK